ncbi:MAG: HAMP domain-containing sensor histidine kinase [Bacteroidales bacterium]
MIKNKRQLLIPVLMVASQLLLVVFVFQWLRMQFRDEKKQLQKDLTSFYIEASDQVVDTLIFNRYISPIMDSGIVIHKDTVTLTSKYISSGSEAQRTGIVRLSRPLDTNLAHGIVSIKVKTNPDSVGFKSNRHIELNEDFFIRGVKLMVDKSSRDTMDIKTGHAMTFMLTPDTAMFKRHFSDLLRGAGLDLAIAWEEKGIDSAGNNMKRMINIGPYSPFNLPDAAIIKYNGYVFRKIFPQFAFGLVLIILTAAAFWLSYRSIRNHQVIDNLRTEFIYNITHELKTPVSTLNVVLEALGKYNMKEDRKVTDEYLSIAAAETRRLAELINKVLDQSLLGEDNDMMNFSDCDPDEIAGEVTAIMSQRLPGGGNIQHVSSPERKHVRADRLILKGVLINLVDNSLKYCDKVPDVRIITGTESGFYVIRVSDNGPGIPREYQKRIFEKFFRIPSGTHDVKGYGLGLSFAAMAIRLHDGSIEVNNTDPGCCFTIKLPLNA